MSTTSLQNHTGLPEYSWQEIAKHNSSSSAWVYIEDDVFDVTKFLDRHPGGKDMLLLMAGRDITNIFASYHPFTDKPKQLIQKFKIGKLKGRSEFGTFKPDCGFYKTLSKRVGKYFIDNNLDYKNPYPGILRYLFITFMILIPWYFAWTCNNNNETCNLAFRHRIYLMIISGIFQGMLLIHTMHDCSHTSLSHYPIVWKYLGRLSLDFTAGSSFDAWLHQHTVGHHVYTNMLEVDPDCPIQQKGDLRRVMPSQHWSVQYAFQYIWLPLLYGLYAFKNRIQDLSQTLFGGYNGAMRVNPEFRDNESLFRQLLAKSLWIIRRIIYPLFILNNNFFYEFLPLFLIMEFSTGYFLTYNFQVSHVSTEVNWPSPIKDLKTNKLLIPGEWAKLQVETCVDYAHDSLWCTFFSGALNYQSIHHLFPCVSQYHYPGIRPIVLETCEEFGVRFNHVPTFSKAFYLHLKQLYDMSFPNDVSKKLN